MFHLNGYGDDFLDKLQLFNGLTLLTYQFTKRYVIF